MLKRLILKAKLSTPAKSFFLLFVVLIIGVLAIFRYADKMLIDDQIFYLLMGNTFVSDVYVRYTDGSLKKLSPTENGIYYQAHINRDGTKVVFYGNETGPPQLWSYNLLDDTCLPLTPSGISARHPVFSYDGKQIAFSSDFGIDQARERIELMHGNGTPPDHLTFNIFTMDLEGQHPKQITFGNYRDQRPAFSPNGRFISFVSDRNGQDQIWIVSSDGADEPQPLQKSGYGYRPWFSQDGNKIYFFSEVNGRHQICFIDLQKREIIPLENNVEGKSHGPFVDYRLKLLLTHSNRSGKWNLFELPLDGGPERSIQPPEFEEALHVTRSSSGIIAFDVPQISKIRRLASAGHQWTKKFRIPLYMQTKKAKRKSDLPYEDQAELNCSTVIPAVSSTKTNQ